MRVAGHRRTWRVADLAGLADALAWCDDHGGARLWLAPDDAPYPALAIRISGGLADIHYFPQEGHPGLRCLGGGGLPSGGLTRLVYQGADPASGEDVPNEFVVPVEWAAEIAAEFFQSRQMSAAVQWFEL